MDPEQTFIRVQERFSEMLSPKIRVTLEYLYLLIAITLFCILVVMHANYVQQMMSTQWIFNSNSWMNSLVGVVAIVSGVISVYYACLLCIELEPGCSSELSVVELSEAQLIRIKITSAGLWTWNESEYNEMNGLEKENNDENSEVANVVGDGLNVLSAKLGLDWITSGAMRDKSPLKFWKTNDDLLESQAEGTTMGEGTVPSGDDEIHKVNKDGSRSRFLSPKESLKAAVVHLLRKWHGRVSFCWRIIKRILGALWDIAGIHLNLDIPKWLKILHLDRLNFYLNSYAVQWLGKRSKVVEPTYLYTMEKGYFLLPEEARSRHNIRTINVSISALHPCFGNRWQQLLINRLVGYDTILMNSLLNSPGQGYLYNYQTNEFYNLTYAQKQPESSTRFGDYLVTKCGVLMMSLFVFFTTTMSVSFTLRETQTRMLKFTVQLQHHARHRLPTFQLIFVHVIESLVFVPIMIGILFFLFEFYDDQLLAFMVLILVWLCELFTLISVRTPISMKFFPRFFLLYFLVFHIYFFSYTYGFSYLALSTTAAFMQHLILYFWNRFEVPALQRYVQNRRSHFQQHPDFHITSSTILASTLHITRLNTRNPRTMNSELASGPGLQGGVDPAVPVNGPTEFSGFQERPDNGNADRLGNSLQLDGQQDLRQSEAGGSPGSMNSFSSLLLWILGGASSEGLSSFLSIFRDIRDQGQVFAGSPQQENHAPQNTTE